MDRKAFREELSFRLTGGILDLELDDKALDKVIDASLREVQRYITVSHFVTLPFEKCIDFSKYNASAIMGVYRTKGFTNNESLHNGTAPIDPMYLTQWQMLTGVGNVFSMSDFVYNYAAWNTVMQIRNTTSTDLSFIYDDSTKKLYINVATGQPDKVTVEFIPQFQDISDIKSDHWIDVTMRLAVALAKITLGRIRSRYTLTNSPMTQDGDRLLDEGNAELADLREHLRDSNLANPID